MIQIPLTPDKYQAALKHLMDLRPPEVSSVQLPIDSQPGQVLTPQIKLDFTYDGENINVNILEKHGFAKFASDSTIKAHLEDLLTGV